MKVQLPDDQLVVKTRKGPEAAKQRLLERLADDYGYYFGGRRANPATWSVKWNKRGEWYIATISARGRKLGTAAVRIEGDTE
jgi:hypothetical protein